MTEHLTSERLDKIEAGFGSFCGDEGDAYELFHAFHEDIPLLTAEIRRLRAGNERLEVAFRALLSMMRVDTCPYETNNYCPFTPGDDCKHRNVTDCWAAWANKQAEAEGPANG